LPTVPRLIGCEEAEKGAGKRDTVHYRTDIAPKQTKKHGVPFSASPFSASKFVGIANGQVVVVTDDLDDLARRLRQAEPDPNKTLCVEASCDYDEVHEIWGLN
jgi:hypothetical protein